MSLRLSSAKRRTKASGSERLNLVPILDAVFIIIFFFLTASQIRMMELATDIPTVSTDTTPPPKNDKPPLNLTLKVRADRLDLLTGVPGDLVKTIMNKNKDYDYDGLHTFLVALKGQHPHENTIVFEPIREVDYQVVVSIMDAVRTFRFDDPQIVKVDPVTGVEEPMKSLFDDIVFGNIEGK